MPPVPSSTHLLDPSTGQPAWTGVVQATALAPTALEAETLAKAALLAGPGSRCSATAWLDATIADIAIPFASEYRPFWTGLGIIGGYGIAPLWLSYDARARIGAARAGACCAASSRSAGCWASCTRSAPAPATDAGQPWFLLLAAAVVLAPLALLGMRRRSRVELAPGDGVAVATSHSSPG